MAERWQEIASELADYGLESPEPTFIDWLQSQHVGDGRYLSDWVESYAAVKAIEARDQRIAELEAENAALAADQCHKGYGDDRGNHRCAYQDRIADLENQLDIANAKLAKAEGGGSTPFDEIQFDD
jgi:uncharacterized protein YhaN